MMSATTSGRSFEPPGSAPRLLGLLRQSEDHRERRLPREAAAHFASPKPYRRESRLDGIRRPDVPPVLGWEVVEGQELLPVLSKTLGRLRILRLIDFDEEAESLLGLSLRRSQVDLVQMLLGLRLLRLRQFVQHVGRLMHPASLLAYLAVDLAQRLPEAQRAVAAGQLRRDLQAPLLQIDEQLAPGLRALPIAVLDGQQLLLPSSVAAMTTGRHCAS